jgi:hypothetical protein
VSTYSRRPAKRRSPLLRPALTLLGVVIAFVVGLALGKALEDGPAPGGTRTSVRKLEPRSLPPAPRTVTVTTSD